MTIKRPTIAPPINARSNQREIPSYCPRCAANGIRSHETMLKPRLDYFAYDREDWRQCYFCANIIGKPDIPKPGELTTDIEPVRNKFNLKQDDEMDIPRPKHRRGFNERLNRNESEIKDPELKRELKKGAKLISYTEQ